MSEDSGLALLLLSIAFGVACGAPGSVADAGGVDSSVGDAPPLVDASLPPLCEGALVPLDGWTPAADTPFVTLADDSGRGCVLALGESMADVQVCGQPQPTALIEPGCPFTSVVFTVWGSSYVRPELGVQGAYAYTYRDGLLQNGRVTEMVVDSMTANIARGHFQIAFDAAGDFDATAATGTFALCATSGLTVEPCRQPDPP